MIDKTMHATITKKAHEDFVAMETVQMPIPRPKAGQVLVRSVATSVNPIDIKMQQGLAFPAKEYPAILHTDFAGIVEEIGEGVQDFKKGDAVYGCCGIWGDGSGALAQYQTVDARLMAHAPQSIPLEHSASLPLVAITAFETLCERLTIEKNAKLLIQSATGGVGHIATQLAVAMGIDTYGITTSDEKCEQIKQNGATAFNRKTGDQLEWAKQRGGFDYIFNTVGGKSLNDAFAMNTEYGTTIGIAGRSSHDLTTVHAKNLTLIFELMITTIKTPERRSNAGAILSKIATLVDEGHITPSIAEHTFTLDTVKEAYTYMLQGKHQGKKVLIHI